MNIKRLHGDTYVGDIIDDDRRVAVVILNKPEHPIGWVMEYRPDWKSKPCAFTGSTIDEVLSKLRAEASKRLGRIICFDIDHTATLKEAAND